MQIDWNAMNAVAGIIGAIAGTMTMLITVLLEAPKLSQRLQELLKSIPSVPNEAVYIVSEVLLPISILCAVAINKFAQSYIHSPISIVAAFVFFASVTAFFCFVFIVRSLILAQLIPTLDRRLVIFTGSLNTTLSIVIIILFGTNITINF